MKKGLRILAIAIIAIISLAVALRVIGFRSMCYEQGKDSMSPTIAGGDICLSIINKQYLSADLKPGMIVLLRHKNYSHLLTKRIIALGGDLVEIQGSTTVVNGLTLDEPYLGTASMTKELGDVKKIRIPPDKLFVMGDNRDNSMDSRFSQFGLIDVNQVVGKPLLVLWSQDKKKIGKWLQ